MTRKHLRVSIGFWLAAALTFVLTAPAVTASPQEEEAARGPGDVCTSAGNPNYYFCVVEVEAEELGFICGHAPGYDFECVIVIPGVEMAGKWASMEEDAEDGPICPDCTHEAVFHATLFMLTCIAAEPNAVGVLTCMALAALVYGAEYQYCAAHSPDPTCIGTGRELCLPFVTICLAGDERPHGVDPLLRLRFGDWIREPASKPAAPAVGVGA